MAGWSEDIEGVWHYYRSRGRTGGYADKPRTENISWRSACRRRTLEPSRPFVEGPPVNVSVCEDCRGAFHEDVQRADDRADMKEKNMWVRENSTGVWHYFEAGHDLSGCGDTSSSDGQGVAETFEQVLQDPGPHCAVCRDIERAKAPEPNRDRRKNESPRRGPHLHYFTSLRLAQEIFDEASTDEPTTQHVGRLAIEVAYLCGRAEKAMEGGAFERLLHSALSGLSEGADQVIQSLGPVVLEYLAQQGFQAGAQAAQREEASPLTPEALIRLGYYARPDGHAVGPNDPDWDREEYEKSTGRKWDPTGPV